MNPFKILKSLLPYLIEIVVAPFIRPVIENNLRRAQTIEIVASAIARNLVAEHPDADWALLVDLAVRLLGEQVPDGAASANPDVLRRVAIDALAKAGVVKPALVK